MTSVLFVATVPVTLEAFLVPFAQHFRSLGWRVDALANGASHDPHIADGFDRRFDVKWSRNPLDPRNLVGSASRVRQVVAEGGYDIVHVHTPIAAFVARFALRTSRKPPGPCVIYTAHGFHFYEGARPVAGALFRTMERLAAPWTDYLVTINQEDYLAAQEFRGIPRSRVRLIPGIGVDTSRFEPAAIDAESVASIRSELSLPPSAFVVTMLAEFAPVKRHSHVLDALEQVRDPDVVLVLVGNGPLEAAVRDEVTRRGLSERVRFAGYRRDVPEMLAASSALLLASEREGLARSVLEGMAAGLPIIGTRTRGITDAVGEDAGWLAEKNDASALARSIEAAASDRTEAKRRGEIGRERARRDFALPHIIQAYEDLYREALASRV